MEHVFGIARARDLLLPALLLFGSACNESPPASLGAEGDDPTTEVTSDTSALGGNVVGAIQIDGPISTNNPGADLFPDAGVPLNVGATLDWVANSATTTADSLSRCIDDTDGASNCAEDNVTRVAGGTGNWNGLRIVDDYGAADQNVFNSGGKENDTSTWTIASGNAGGSKNDLTQAYLANNQTSLFFGMERAGNNGSTAFDFEFNQFAPMSDDSCVQNPLIPCRTQGDILFTFEMQGSGQSGSATPYVFEWDGDSYEPWVPEAGQAVPVATINNSTSTAGAPWGHVNSQGTWVSGNLARFTFAEAVADLSLLPGVNNCGGKAFVQVRTRSSPASTSDLKDTTRVFEFVFGSITASASLTPSCAQNFGYAATAVDQNGAAIPGQYLGCAWTFTNGAGASTTCSGTQTPAPGTYSGTVVVTDTRFNCSDDATTDSVHVYAPLGGTADLAADCSATLDIGYDANATGGSGAYTYAWSFSGGGTVSPSSASTSENGTLIVGTAGVAYSGTVTITDSRTDLPGQCTWTPNDSATPYAPLHVDLQLAAAAPTCPGMASDAVTYNTANVSGGSGSYTYTWYGPSCSGTSCTINPADDLFCAAQSVYVTLTDDNAATTGCGIDTSETENYSKVTTITASSNP